MKKNITNAIILLLLCSCYVSKVFAESQYIRNWLICGPFIGETLFSETSDESKLDPIKGDIFKDETRRKYSFIKDVLNLEEEKAFGYVDTCVGYAFVRIISPKKQYAQLRFGSDDGIRVWFNGSEVLANEVKRNHQKDQERLIVVLEKGENRLLVKIWDFYAGYGFSARICSPDGSEIDGLKFIPKKNNLSRIPIKRVVASSVQGDDMEGFNPLYAADDNMKTRWSSNHYDPQWIRLDFAEDFNLARLDIFSESAYTKLYSVDVSQDARIWKTIYETKHGVPGHKILLFDPPVRTNFVRMFCTQKATPWGNSIWKLAAYGLPVSGKQKISYEASISRAVGEIIQPVKIETASTSSIQPESFNRETKKRDNYGPQNAIDNNLLTRWSSMHQEPQWLTMDLGAKKEFSEIRIVWETAHASDYKIEVSDNNINWKEIYSTDTADGIIDVIMFEKPISARFIKLTCLKRATEWGFSVWEFWVF
ncbi:MAG: discoidin domain-containing protein [Candidatus Theseobacter exili]|nr:discoidin domain-containing protein [Candidatus Theseobacter exili]